VTPMLYIISSNKAYIGKVKQLININVPLA